MVLEIATILLLLILTASLFIVFIRKCFVIAIVESGPGDVIVTNSQSLDEHHEKQLRHAYDAEGKRTIKIPSRSFFVRGDYPIGGIDSRIFGPVSYESILGVVMMRFDTVHNM